MNEITNRDLADRTIPSPAADWQAIAEFALTLNGYEVWGSFEKCAEIANARKCDTLTELRTCLFFEQRRWRQQGEDPDAEALIYLRGLIEKIRTKVAASEFD